MLKYEPSLIDMRRVECKLEAPSGRMKSFSGTVSQLAREVVSLDGLYVSDSKTPWGARCTKPFISYKYRIHKLKKRGGNPYPHPLTRSSFFTNTTKMAAPSFSLPAGPPGRLGGTCLQANNSRLIDDDVLYICRNCYAVSGEYIYASTQLGQAINLEFVKQWLDTDPFGSFLDIFQAAFSDYGTSARTQGAITVKVAGVKFLLSSKHFRIHDSGDVFALGPDYYELWARIAVSNPDVLFWMPTRDHHIPAFRRLVQTMPPPENLVIRPSALHFQDPAPVVEGFAAGSTSAYDGFQQAPIHTLADWDCPAYKGAAHTCTSQNCRVCWDRPDLSVNYMPHSTPSRKHREHIVKRNPSLKTMVKSYGADVKGNPPVPFEAYLVEHGMYPHEFSPNEWFEAFPDKDPDEVVALMAGSAEWQPADHE